MILTIAAGLIVMGCEHNFEPMKDNDLYVFSMYGALDVHADTQWVRVMTFSENLVPENGEHDGTRVTLTRAGTGEIYFMKDSLFVFGNDALVWNYWTTAPLFSNEEYIVEAASTDQRSSTSQVITTSELPLPEVSYSISTDTGVVKGTSEDPVVTAEMHYWMQVIDSMGCSPEMKVIVSHLDQAAVQPDGTYAFEADDLTYIRDEYRISPWDQIRINYREVLIVSGSESWPDLSGLDDYEMTLPDIVSNVENGTGVIAGVAIRKVPILPRQAPC